MSYGDPAVARWTLFGDYEKVQYDSKHRVVGTSTATTPPGPYDPNMPPTASELQLAGTNKDQNYAYGLAIDVPATEKLMVKASFMYYKTDGRSTSRRRPSSRRQPIRSRSVATTTRSARRST